MEGVSAGFASLKALSDFLKALNGLRLDSEILTRIVPLLSDINSIQLEIQQMQNTNHELLRENSRLFEELENTIAWNEQSKNYELFRLASGSCVLVSKEGSQSQYKKIWLCPTCFENRKKAYLQRPHDLNPAVFICQSCKSSISLDQMEHVRL